MFRNGIKTHCNALKTAVGRGNFGAIHTSTVASSKTVSNSGNPIEKENIDITETTKHPLRGENAKVPFKDTLKEHNTVLYGKAEKDTSNVEEPCKAEIIKKMLKTEEHHLIKVIKDKQGNLSDVVWCPVYLRPDASGRVARGGDEVPHHMCKTCGKIGLHLLNDGQKYRPCLRCVGWQEQEIPAWYYHVTCCHCAHMKN